jgi:hypothetical protein
LADFPLQPEKLIKLKKSYRGKLLHAAIHGLIAYLICGQWKFWYLSLIVGIGHILIDLIKKENWRYFLLDQCLHVLFLTGLAFILPFDEVISISADRLLFIKIIVIVSAAFLVTRACGMLIGQIMEEHIKKNGLVTSGLINGGMWIGQFERLLIFLFILFDLSEGIGFLIAAKSILRFSETKEDQKMAEYVLIGTLLSFTLAILISFVVKKILSVT